MLEAICTISILLSNGAHTIESLKGRIINDDHEYWVVDFSKEFKKHKFQTDEVPVQKVNSNACLYANPSKEILK